MNAQTMEGASRQSQYHELVSDVEKHAGQIIELVERLESRLNDFARPDTPCVEEEQAARPSPVEGLQPLRMTSDKLGAICHRLDSLLGRLEI